MGNRTLLQSGVLVVALALSGCGGDASPTPVGPSLIPPQAAAPTPVSTKPDWLSGYTLTAVNLSGVVYESSPAGQVPIAGAAALKTSNVTRRIRSGHCIEIKTALSEVCDVFAGTA